MYSPFPSSLSRFFPLLFLFVCCWLAVPAGAQIRLETVTVFLDDQEAMDSVGSFAPLMITWSFVNPPPGDAQIEFQRGTPGAPGMNAIDTIPLPLDAWGDIEGMPRIRSERYALVLLDAAGESIGSMTNIHGTIFLREWDRAVDFDPCTGTLVLSWDNYVYNESVGAGETPLEPFFSKNELMVLPPGETQEIVAVTLEFGESGARREAVYPFEKGPGVYRFRIRSVENPGGNGRVSYSNYREFNHIIPQLDDFDLTSIDIVDNAFVEVGFSAEGQVGAFEYKVFRSAQPDQGFEEIGEPGVEIPGAGIFADQSVPDLQTGLWYYKMEAFVRDAGCEDPIYESGVLSSLWLTGEVTVQTDDRLEVLLSWDQQPAWDHFVLQRNLPNGDGWTTIGTPFSSPGQTTDDLSAFLQDLSGEIRYRMLGERMGETVHSNEYQVVIEPKVEIPNVFRPDAVDEENRVFKPEFIGFTPSFVRLRVYNRWGQEVFSITNPETGWAGWNGRLNDGMEAPPGMYAYWLEYELPASAKMELRGSVMLIK